MKIIHFIYDSLNNPWLNGGGAHRNHELYQRLAKNHDVTIVCGNFPGALNNIDNVRYKHVGFKSSYLLSRLSYIFCVWYYAIFSKADIYIEDIGFPSPLLLSLLKRPVIGSVQFIPNAAFVKKRGILGKMVVWGYRVFLRTYTHVITVSEYAKRELEQYTRSSVVTVIPNGVNLPSGVDLPTSTIKRFLFLGRIDIHGKGIDTLIEAWRRAAVDSAELVIAGAGESDEVAKMEALIDAAGTANVRYHGYVKALEKDELIRSCYAMILPSRNETSSLAALEAFAYGKPVIGSDIGGMSEVLSQSKAAIPIKDNDVEKFADAIKELIVDHSTYTNFSANAISCARTQTWDEIAKKYEAYLNEKVPHEQ